MIMGMLLNRVYRCIYDSEYYGEIGRESFCHYIATTENWHHMLRRLAEKQVLYPERNYRLQILDESTGNYLDYPLVNSKYALFSED